MNLRKIAVDLTWVRHKKVGGTESYIRNLLDGISKIDTEGMVFFLLVAKDNMESFHCYKKELCFKFILCNTKSSNQKERILWQNLKMGKMLKKLGITVCFEPIYGKPFFGTKGIKFITTIHDLQAKHYPQYFSRARVFWMKASWKNAVTTSEQVVAISKYVKQDLLDTFHLPDKKVEVIYNAVALDVQECSDEIRLKSYGIEKGKYYYTVSSLFLHKNLKTVILAMAELKKRKSKVFFPFVISGIGGKNRGDLEQLIMEYDLKDDIKITPFIETKDRNLLYKNCKAFLFPSIFEGFGMPPVEAMAMRVPVLTTKCTSLEEVTGGLLNYVENPFDPTEWADRLEGTLRIPCAWEVSKWIDRYQCSVIAKDYIWLFEHLF